MDEVRKKTFIMSALAAWNNTYRLHENPSKIDIPEIHKATSIDEQMFNPLECVPTESRYSVDTDQSQIYPDSTVSAYPRQSSIINKVLQDRRSISTTRDIASPISPTYSSASEVPTPQGSPCPASGKRQWAQEFTSRAGAVSREVLAFAFDELWSPEYEKSPAFSDRPIPCRLPTTRNKSKLTQAEAFDELDKVFRDVDVSKAKARCPSPKSLLDRSITICSNTQTNEGIFKVLDPKPGTVTLQDSVPIQTICQSTAANLTQSINMIILTSSDIMYLTHKCFGKGRKPYYNQEDLQQSSECLIDPF